MTGSKWITRSNVKVDRVACPWLIRRFIDPAAEFIFAIPFDAPRLPEVKLNHRGDRCTFEALIEDFKLSDPVLHRLAMIVRAADVKGQEHVAPEGLGLRAIAEGFSKLEISDHERLKLGFPIYDALYRYAAINAG